MTLQNASVWNDADKPHPRRATFNRLGSSTAAQALAVSCALALGCAPESNADMETGQALSHPKLAAAALPSWDLGANLHKASAALSAASVTRKSCRRPLDRSAEGTWLSDPYGFVLDIRSQAFSFYQVSEHSCFAISSGDDDGSCHPELAIDVSAEGYPWVVPFRTDVRGSHLTLSTSTTQSYPFTHVRSLPQGCAHGVTAPSDDPELNFELFWEHFNEHYAFFKLHGVDWRAQYTQNRPQVTASTSSDQLFAIMQSMVVPLEDYHVFLASDSDSYARPPPDDIIAAAPAINAYMASHYLGGPGVTLTGNGQLAYQRMDDGVGLIEIVSMEDYPSADMLAASPDPLATELAQASAAIDEALSALHDARALIVDVRFNSGGLDGVALTIAGRFADRRRFAYDKRARGGAGMTAPRSFYVEPAGIQRPARPIVLLTSQLSVSAAEIFVLAMRVLPNVVVMGEQTAGAHSDIMARQLPNGWRLGLSNEVYRAADGRVYEGIGIPVDVRVPLDAAGFGDQRDSIAEAARARLRR